MTTSPFAITPTPPTFIRLAPGQEGKLSFTVTSLAAPDQVHEVILQALLMSEDGKGKEVDWLVVAPRPSLSVSGGKTETVAIIARPTADSPRGEHKIQLVIADRDRPNDVYAYSSSVACEVLAPAGGKRSKKPLPWWLIPAIVGGLLAAGVSVFAVRSCKETTRSAIGQPCKVTKDCNKGLRCVDGRCAAVSAPCGECGGVVQPDGTCSKPTPPNLGQPCGECGGKVTCAGTCSNNTPRCPPGFAPIKNLCRSLANPFITRPQCTLFATTPPSVISPEDLRVSPSIISPEALRVSP